MVRQLLLAMTISLGAAPPCMAQAPATPELVTSRNLTQAFGPGILAQIQGQFTCPDNTVHSAPFDESAQQKSVMRSDECGPGGLSQTFQPFEGVRNPINGIRVFGTFCDKSFRACTGRVQVDDQGNMTEPIKLEATVWTQGSNGLAGELVHKVVADVVGVKMGTNWDEEPVYSFTIPFDETLRMERGYVSVRAVGEERNLACCFMLVSHTNISPSGYIAYTSDDGQTNYYNGSFVYCLTGDPEESLAQHALDIKGLISPNIAERGRYAKTQVEVYNFGDQPLTDATLSLIYDGNVVATEKIDRRLESGETYKYTFKKRIDLSAIGDHVVSVRNDTPGDDMYAGKEVSITIDNSGEVVASSSSYQNRYKYITHVKIGDIDNESDWSLYTDYRGLYTSIKPGETLPMTIDCVANNGDFLKVYVDWNGNGVFQDDGEFMGYVSNSTIDIKIPDGIDAEPGDKCMRILLCGKDYDAPPYGYYTFGETEDYTLTVEPADNGPQLQTSEQLVDLGAALNETAETDITLSNKGNEELTGRVNITYALSGSPESMGSRRLPPAETLLRKPTVQATTPPTPAAVTSPAADETADEAVPFVLQYGNGYSGGVGAASTYVDFAHYYPGDMLAPLAGMQVTSVDVYVEQKAPKSYITLRGQYAQNIAGDVITKQQFNAVPNSWNHVVLDNPVTLSDQDLWVGLSLEGAANLSTQIGQDKRPAVRGFGDLVSTEGNNYWWSLADLGYDHNVLIRANVTGTPTPAISWLTVGQSTLSIPAGQEAALQLQANTQGLTDGLYEATVTLSTNDPCRSLVDIPVYLRAGQLSGITLPGAPASATRLTVTVSGGLLQVQAPQAVTGFTLYGADGRLALPRTQGATARVDRLPAGVYVVKAELADGTTDASVVTIN